MENIKELFVSVRKGLENFSAQVTHSTQHFNSKQRALANGTAFGTGQALQ